MKAKFLFILLSVLFVIPVDAAITKHKNRKSKIGILKVDREVQTLFQSPLPDAEITVTDKDENAVIYKPQTSIY